GSIVPIDAAYESVCDALHITKTSSSSPGKKRRRTKLKAEDLCELSKMEVRNTVYNIYKERKHLSKLFASFEITLQTALRSFGHAIGAQLKPLKLARSQDKKNLVKWRNPTTVTIISTHVLSSNGVCYDNVEFHVAQHDVQTTSNRPIIIS
ncbi:hypothetical protein Trydic_g361, partial [Trypoxylus dichotomus]